MPVKSVKGGFQATTKDGIVIGVFPSLAIATAALAKRKAKKKKK